MARRVDELNSQIGVVTNVQRYSIQDGPGIRTTIFLKGCRLRCKWCHNPEGQRLYPEIFQCWRNCNGCGDCVRICPSRCLTLTEGNRLKIDKGLCITCLQCVDVCKTEALICMGKFVSVAELLDEVKQDEAFYRSSGGGVTLSGGDPLAQPDFALALLKDAKEQGVHTALDTAGHAPWTTLENFIDYTDLFLYDIKNMDSERHTAWSGADNKLILCNARKLAQRARMRIRVPVVPGVNDSPENMEETARFAESLGENVEGVDLLPFHIFAGAKYSLFGLEYPWPLGTEYDEERILDLAQIFKSRTKQVTIGG